MKLHHIVLGILSSACILNGCGKATNGIPKEEIAIVSSEPQLSFSTEITFQSEHKKIEPSDPYFVPEKIAHRLVQLLKKETADENNKLAKAILTCSAFEASLRMGSKSACAEAPYPEAEGECAMNLGYGKRAIGQALAAVRIDLNGDNKEDYLIADRYYCNGIHANQASAYFVLISKGETHELAFAEWEMGLDVVSMPGQKNKLLIGRGYKTYGIFSRIMELQENGKYKIRACVTETEKAYEHC